MGQHSVVRGEEGKYTKGAHKATNYTGKHREGTAKGSSGQQKKDGKKGE